MQTANSGLAVAIFQSPWMSPNIVHAHSLTERVFSKRKKKEVSD